MNKNLGVTYIDIGLNSVLEYWNELVCPKCEEFTKSPAPAALFGAALPLWHLHSWVGCMTFRTRQSIVVLVGKWRWPALNHE